jgi:NTP pyrophosphatase (non-canonical NTP hydrolase)
VKEESDARAEASLDGALGKELRWLQRQAHETAQRKGWYAKVRPGNLTRDVCTWIALMHSELSEALEEVRKFGDEPEGLDARADFLDRFREVRFREKDGKPEGLPTEFADIVIRVMDTCEYLGIDLFEVVRRKMAFNESRPYKHGGKAV